MRDLIIRNNKLYMAVAVIDNGMALSVCAGRCKLELKFALEWHVVTGITAEISIMGR
jgi:hypothetical protein